MNLRTLLKHHQIIDAGSEENAKIVCTCSWHSRKGDVDTVWDEWVEHIVARAMERK